MKFLTQNQARNLYNNGAILENRRNREYVVIFSICGFHFTSTDRRVRKGKNYKLDDKYWCIYPGDIFTKLRMIFSGRVRKIKKG